MSNEFSMKCEARRGEKVRARAVEIVRQRMDTACGEATFWLNAASKTRHYEFVNDKDRANCIREARQYLETARRYRLARGSALANIT
jgi:hypothetical protein